MRLDMRISINSEKSKGDIIYLLFLKTYVFG
jgi:hypothetical protein